MFSSLVWGDINCCALCVLDPATRVALRQACWCVGCGRECVFEIHVKCLRFWQISCSARFSKRKHTAPPRCSRTDNHERQRSSDLQSFKLAATQWDLLRFLFSWPKHLAPCQVKQRVLLHQGSLFEMESEWPQAGWCGYLLECPRLPVGDAVSTPPCFFHNFLPNGVCCFHIPPWKLVFGRWRLA
jgi:hypothetical protein